MPLPVENMTLLCRESGQGPGPMSGAAFYERIFDRLARQLFRSLPAQTLLVGENGVGQSALLLEFARRVLEEQYEFLKGYEVVVIDCRFVPPDEVRLQFDAIMRALERPENEHLVFCMNGFARLLVDDAGMDNRSRLMAALSRVKCRIIGLVNPRECREILSHSMLREGFGEVDLPEPDPELSIALVRHLCLGLQQKFDLAIEDGAIRQAVWLSHHYIPNAYLPHKAIRLLSEECEDAAYERSQLGQSARTVGAEDILRRVSAESGIPEQTLKGTGDNVDYRQSLGEFVVGQDAIIDEIATDLSLIRAGMSDPGKPASVLLLVGQTGTGKTELAKALARFYSGSKTLKTFTLGNFVEAQSVSGIIGVPPGYVGHDEGGRLVNELLADPYSVFLLDEVDKAHPDVLAPFLNLFDEGWVYDQRGVKAWADRAIFVMTTNVGQRQIAEMRKQGKPIEEIKSRLSETLSSIRHANVHRPVFPPEFLARLSRVLIFNPLDAEAMSGITRLHANRLQDEWISRRGKTIEFDQRLIQAIADEAQASNEKANGREGGRIVRKLFADRIEARIQSAIGASTEAYQQAAKVCVTIEQADQEFPQVIVRFE